MNRAERDDSLQDLHNSSHHMKAEFNNRFIIHLEISTLPPGNPGRLSSNIGLFNRFQDINLFFCAATPLKVDNFYREIFFVRIIAFLLLNFSQKLAMNAFFLVH